MHNPAFYKFELYLHSGETSLTYDETNFYIKAANGEKSFISVLYQHICFNWSVKERKLKAFQHKAGLMPLYIYIENNKIVMANDLKLLVTNVKAHFEPFKLNFNFLGLTTLHETHYKNIFVLKNGDLWEINFDDFINEPDFYSYINYKKVINEDICTDYAKFIHKKSENKIIDFYGDVFIESVDLFSNNESNGVFLSGGIDSVAVAACLHYLGKPLIFYHFERPGYITDKDTLAVRNLKEDLKLRGKIDIIDWHEKKNVDKLNESIEYNFNSITPSAGLYYQGVEYLSNFLVPKASIFNGEYNMLDMATSEQNDKYRRIKRFLFYTSIGRKLCGSHLHKNVNPNKRLIRFLEQHFPFEINRWMRGLDKLDGLVHCIGHPENCYMGRILHGLPGKWQTDYNKIMYNSNLDLKKIYNYYIKYLINHFDEYNNDYFSYYIDFITKLITESSNVTIPRNIINAFGFTYIQPFNYSKLTALTAVLPLKLIRDKTILREVVEKRFGISHKIAYNYKNHSNPLRKDITYFWNKTTNALLLHIDFNSLSKELLEIGVDEKIIERIVKPYAQTKNKDPNLGVYFYALSNWINSLTVS